MRLTTVKTVHDGAMATPASALFCTATDCEGDAVMAVIVDGEFEGYAYCRRRGHRAEVLADARAEAEAIAQQGASS